MTGFEQLSFGDTLRCARVARGLKIDDVAQGSQHSQGYLSMMERDKVQPSAEFLQSIAPYYGCPWWNPRRNQQWLQALAWLSGNMSIDKVPGGGDQVVQSSTERAAEILALAEDAMAQDPTMREEWDHVLGRVQLPGLHRLSFAETLPVWAWIVASVDGDRWKMSQERPAAHNLHHILQVIKDTLQMDIMDVDGRVLADQIRRHRNTLGWTPENLARAVNELWGARHEGEPLVDTEIIEAVEDARAPVSLDVLSSLGEVFQVPPSSLLTPPQDESLSDAEERVVDALRAYGLGAAAISALRDIIRLLRGPSSDR